MVEYIAAVEPQYGIALRRSLLGGQHICKPGDGAHRFQCGQHRFLCILILEIMYVIHFRAFVEEVTDLLFAPGAAVHRPGIHHQVVILQVE